METERESARRAYQLAQERRDQLMKMCTDVIAVLGIATDELTAARIRYEATLSPHTET
jgi:hypothetical protein